MTTTENKPAQAPALHVPPPQKTKIEKAQGYLALISTSIGVLGAVGTGFVWLAATFFTGDVQIIPDKPVPSLVVKVVNGNGQQSLYYSKYLALMPGDYHLEFGLPDKQPTVHTDVHVNLWKKTEIAYAVPANLVDQPPESEQEQAQDDKAKKKWWQFWKRSK